MTTATTDWTERARELADELEQAGKLSDPRWRAAIEAVPRHALVPTFHQQDRLGVWNEVTSTTTDGLAAVYSDRVLVTALTDTPAGVAVLSSSTQPGLMTRMLETLDVREGHHVLEIGTGTGYNAALLTHLLGAHHVVSVDVEPELVALARTRLAALGHHPTLITGDGSAGLDEHALFDRIIATCSVPRIPWPWVEHTRPGGIILTDFKPALGAGNLVRLVRQDDHAEGHFDPVYAGFMPLRHHPGTSPIGARVERGDDRSRQRTSSLDPHTPWTSLIVWFLAALDLGAGLAYGYSGPDPTHSPTASWITTGDGSWAEITITGDHNGQHQVTEGGPRNLWSIVENAHQRWHALGQPGWDRFGLTITRELQSVFVETPETGTRSTLAILDTAP